PGVRAGREPPPLLDEDRGRPTGPPRHSRPDGPRRPPLRAPARAPGDADRSPRRAPGRGAGRLPPAAPPPPPGPGGRRAAFCCMLLAGTGLLAKSLWNQRRLDLGFPTRDLLTARIALFQSRYPESADRARFFAELVRRLGEEPGVQAVAATPTLPTLDA